MALLSPVGIAVADEPDPEYSVLVFSKTAGFRHGSSEAGKEMITQMGADNNFQVDKPENSEDFTEENMANYDALLWLCTTGTVLTGDPTPSFENYMQPR